MANKKQIWKPQQRNLLDFLPRPRNMVKLIYDQQRRLNLTETKQHSLQLFALVPNTIFCRILIPYSQFCCCSIFPSSPQAALSLLSGWSGGTSCITTIPGLLYHFPHLSINCIQLLFHMWHFLSHKKTTNLGYYILVKYPIKFTIIRYWILVKYRTKSTTMRYWIDPFSKSPIQSTHKSNKPTNLINH